MDTQSPVSPIFDLLSLAELADRLHVSAQTIDGLRKKGRAREAFASASG